MEPRTAPQQPKPEPKPETTLVPKVEPAAPAKPAVPIEPVVVVRQPAPPRTEVKAEPKAEPKAEVKVEPMPEPPSPRFTRIQPGGQPKPEPEPQPAAPPADDLQSVFRRKPEEGAAAQTVPSFGYQGEVASTGKHRWILSVVVALIVVVVGVYFFVIRPNRHTAEEAPAAAEGAPAHRQVTDLPLRVEGLEGVLTIFWDGLAAPISTAPRGVLSIRDGGTKNVDLTSDELKKGTYQYKPRTDDVLVRLELKGLPGGQNAYGVTHIFGARRLGKASGQ